MHSENNQLLKPVGPPEGRAEQPRKQSGRSTIYRKPRRIDLSEHPASILSEEGIREDARAYLLTVKH